MADLQHTAEAHAAKGSEASLEASSLQQEKAIQEIRRKQKEMEEQIAELSQLGAAAEKHRDEDTVMARFERYENETKQTLAMILRQLEGIQRGGASETMELEESQPLNLLAVPTPTCGNRPPRQPENLHGHSPDNPRNRVQPPDLRPLNQVEGDIRVEPQPEDEDALVHEDEAGDLHRPQDGAPANCCSALIAIILLTSILLGSFFMNIFLLRALTECGSDVPILRVENDLRQCYNVTALEIGMTEKQRVFRVQVSARKEFNRDMEQERRLRQQIEELTIQKTDAEMVIRRHLEKTFCKVYFRGKCFWSTLRDSITFAQAESICAEVTGGRPGIFYNDTHYELVLEHIRGLTSYTSVWLGLEINPPTKEVVIIPERSPAPFVKWHYSYPSSVHTSTGVRLQVVRDKKNTGTGMYNNNNRLTDTAHGVLCEA